MFKIVKDPSGNTYRELIELAFDICDEFHLVLRKDMGDLSKFEPILRKFDQSFKFMKEQSEWASNILGDNQTAKVYYFSTDEHAKKTVLELSNSLFSWVFPDLPEDLSFFKEGEDWLATNSHESECYIMTSDESEIVKINAIKGLSYEIEED
jgi:hypothetical protein